MFFFDLSVSANLGETTFHLGPYIYAFIITSSLTMLGLYRFNATYDLASIIKRVSVSFVVSIMLLVLLAVIEAVFFEAVFFTVPPNEAMNFVPTYTATFFSVLFLHHQYLRRIECKPSFRNNVLVLGAGDRANLIAGLGGGVLQTSCIRGFVKCNGDKVCIQQNKLIEVETDSLESYVAANNIHEIVFVPDDRRIHFPADQLLACKMRGVKISGLLSFIERETGKMNIEGLTPSWLIFSEGFAHSRFKVIQKRTIDVVFSFLLLITLLPVLILVGLAIVLDDGGEVFYLQKRVGRNGRIFKIYKFRSMFTNAETKGAQWAQEDDPRITRVGRFIRKYRLDELPQLLNVFMGEMSLVGPRPERPEFVTLLTDNIPFYEKRHFYKPGLTGWAQLNYPYGSSEKDALEKLKYDLYYIKYHSMVFDFLILLMTVEIVFFKKGAR
jgi:sugar transferase (PEP-CTERM system associated)